MENRVAVYSENSTESKWYEIPGFSPDKVKVDRQSDMISAPIETGQRSFDNKVRKPLVITVTGTIPRYEDTYAKSRLLHMWENREFEFYAVTTKDGAYINLCLKDMTTENTTEKYDLQECTLVFMEAMLIQSYSSSSVSDSENSPSHNGGIKAGE